MIGVLRCLFGIPSLHSWTVLNYYGNIHLKCCKDIKSDPQEPERSCLISSFSGMSWMAALIFSRIAMTALCHLTLQWRRSSSQSVHRASQLTVTLCDTWELSNDPPIGCDNWENNWILIICMSFFLHGYTQECVCECVCCSRSLNLYTTIFCDVIII